MLSTKLARATVASLMCLLSCKDQKPPPRAPNIEWPATVSPPFGLSQLASGMTLDDAKRALPALIVAADKHSLTLSAPAGEAVVAIDPTGRVADISVRVDECDDTKDALTSKWGVPELAPWQFDSATRSWFDASTGWSATYRPGPTPERDAKQDCYLDFLSKGYFSERAKPPGSLASLQRGMTTQAAARLSDATAGGYRQLSGAREFAASLLYHGGLFEYADTVMSVAVFRLMQSAWGNGTAYSPRKEKRIEWLDQAGTWRALMVESVGIIHVRFQNYVPWVKWLGDGDAVAEVTFPILGKNVDDLKQQFGAFLQLDVSVSNGHQLYHLELPATEWSPEAYTDVDLTADANVVRDYSFDLWFDSEETKKAMLEELTKKWGSPTSTVAGWTFHSKTYGVIAVQDNDKLAGLSVLSVKIGSVQPPT